MNKDNMAMRVLIESAKEMCENPAKFTAFDFKTISLTMCLLGRLGDLSEEVNNNAILIHTKLHNIWQTKEVSESTLIGENN